MIFRADETAVSHTVMAFIGIHRCLGWHGSRIPDRIAVFYIVIFSVGINRECIVTVAGDAKQFGIFIETVTSAGI